MVYQRCILELPCTEVARNLNVDPSTVYRTVQLFEETGTVCSIQGYRESPFKKLTPHDEFAILDVILDKPSTYLKDVQQHLLQTTGTDVCIATLCMYLQSAGFTRKKLTLRAQQRSDELREQFINDISIYDPSMLVFVDETGSDKRTTYRRYGYAFKGRRAIEERLLVRGKRFSAVGIMCIDGLLDTYITDHTIDGEEFCTFIERCLLPQLLPFNGTNPRSVVIMDNASIHHVEPAVELIEEHGAMLHFLPPYSPDLDPIEEAFSKVKHFLRSNDPIFQVCDDSDIIDIILQGFATITADDCYGWMKHSGYVQ